MYWLLDSSRIERLSSLGKLFNDVNSQSFIVRYSISGYSYNNDFSYLLICLIGMASNYSHVNSPCFRFYFILSLTSLNILYCDDIFIHYYVFSLFLYIKKIIVCFFEFRSCYLYIDCFI